MASSRRWDSMFCLNIYWKTRQSWLWLYLIFKNFILWLKCQHNLEINGMLILFYTLSNQQLACKSIRQLTARVVNFIYFHFAIQRQLHKKYTCSSSAFFTFYWSIYWCCWKSLSSHWEVWQQWRSNWPYIILTTILVEVPGPLYLRKCTAKMVYMYI